MHLCEAFILNLSSNSRNQNVCQLNFRQIVSNDYKLWLRLSLAYTIIGYFMSVPLFDTRLTSIRLKIGFEISFIYRIERLAQGHG